MTESLTGEGILAFVALGVGVLIAVIYTTFLRRADRRRITADVERYRGRILSCKWSLGWNFSMFFDAERYYEVAYETESREVFSIVAKTGIFTGVSFRDDTRIALSSQGFL